MAARIQAVPVADVLERPQDGVSVLRRRLPAVPGSFRLRAQLHHMLDALAPSAQRNGTALCLEIVHDAPDALVGDARSLRRTLGDLLALAVRRVEHGQIVLRVGIVSHSAAEVMLRFTVSAVGEHRASTFAFRARFRTIELPRPADVDTRRPVAFDLILRPEAGREGMLDGDQEAARGSTTEHQEGGARRAKAQDHQQVAQEGPDSARQAGEQGQEA